MEFVSWKLLLWKREQQEVTTLTQQQPKTLKYSD